MPVEVIIQYLITDQFDYKLFIAYSYTIEGVLVHTSRTVYVPGYRHVIKRKINVYRHLP